MATSVEDRLSIFVLSRGFVRETGILIECGNRIKTKSGDALLEPVPEDVFELLMDSGVVPVQVRLMSGISVIVVLARRLISRPR
jgi:hypothetical protein